MRIHNALFTILACMFLLGPTGIMLSNACDLDLPDWLTAVESRYLAGDTEEMMADEPFSVEAFESKRLQTALEIELEKNIPMKSNTLLSNAMLQRSCIELSNSFFGWDCYPTFFGSSRLYAPESNALYRMPYNDTRSRIEQFDLFIKYMDEIASDYSDKRFCVYLVDASQCETSNPARDLVHYNLLDIGECADKANSAVRSDNLVFISDAVPESEDYHRYFYSTDHHWNGYGTRRAYTAIAREIGLDDKANPIKGESSFRGLRINGSDARIGLMLLDEPIEEPLFGFPNLKITQGNLAPIVISGVNFAESIPLEAEYDFYHAWFGKGSATLENDRQQGSMLLIGDSYTYSLRWLLSNGCQKLVQRADFASGQPESLEERNRTMRNLISATTPDKVVLVASPGDLISMLDVFEDYFM